ncbi:MAG: amino acid transporter, partial [Angustibacter sp.]
VTVAIPLVAVFLLANAAVILAGLLKLLENPVMWSLWVDSLADLGDWQDVAGPAFLAFPLLVLGLSGFETGVSMMPLVAAPGRTRQEQLAAKIANTRKLLTAAALIMSFYLLTTSFMTTVLIPRAEFAEGGEANGRAMAYLAHELLGNGFGTLYDVSSILILWFAGASAMAGLINIVPRYLPGYGMAPEWGRAIRPMVFVYTALSVIITLLFRADVNAQAGAYATGILAMMVSAAAAVTIAAHRKGQRRATLGYGAVTVVLLYALGENIHEKPDGILISLLFILGTIAVSLISRVFRTTELRADRVEFDETARRFIAESIQYDSELNIIANRPLSEGDTSPEAGTPLEYLKKEGEQRGLNPVPGRADIIFLEVSVIDPSDFSQVLLVEGVDFEGHRILKVQSPAVPNAIAAVLLAIQRGSNIRPKCYFEWSEGNPVKHLMRYLLLGRGDTAPVVREILRTCEPDPLRRPQIHVGG